MVGGTPKPFACAHAGCTMTFTTEDHLNVHQKKHEMDLNLNLGSKTNVFVADQTPTPTRFLRNCEEVGLFQDLQNVNPFEETFRRAVELVKTGSSLPEPNLPADDTLHTPHVFPLLPDDGNMYTTPTIQESSVAHENHIVTSTSVVINSPDHDYALGLETSGKNSASNSLPTKLKLKQVLLKNKKPVTIVDKIQPQTMYFLPVADNNMSHELTTATLNVPILPALSTVNTDEKNPLVAKIRRRCSRKSSDEIDSRKIDMLERNRAAALRCREKRKKWIKNLENKYEVVCQANQNLQKDIANLRNEVLQLKTLLLAHKDCSVTKAMNSGQKIVIETPRIVNVSVEQPGKKLCPVVLKPNLQQTSCDKTKVPKMIHTLDVKDISFVTSQTKKSVIVVNTAYNEISS